MDYEFMEKAIELAKKSQGLTAPNPCVGAVLVKNGKVIGEGWHKKAGEDHAEIMAIKDVDARGATMYVTLEPCCHHGKTPPCAEAIVKAGVKEVFVGMKDPFPNVNGGGIEYLKKHGVKVKVLNSLEVRKLNQPFLKWVKTGLPYVTVKAGMSLDGKIATESGESKWITGDSARNEGRIERGMADALVVGARTVMADDSEFILPKKFQKKKFVRVVLSDKKLNPKLKIFKNKDVIVTNEGVQNLLKKLGKMGVQSVFVEGGSETHGKFFDAGVVDRVVFFVAPKIIGGKGLSVVGGNGVKKLKNAWNFEFEDVEKVGRDLKLTAILNRY